MDVSLLATIVQAVGTLMVAALLRELTRVIPGRFLSYWSAGWLILSVALCSLTVSFSSTYRGTTTAVVLMSVYCVCEYAFGFLLWAGCRNFATGRTVRRRDLPLLLIPVFVGIALPIRLPNINLLLPVHAVLFGGYFLLAFLAIRRYHPTGLIPGVGQKLIQASLIGLFVLFWHYTLVLGWVAYSGGDVKDGPSYLHFSSIYDALIEVGLAFGMVVLATERVRNELEERNRQLADMTDRLEKAAKTDPLTGLLNRRAFDELAETGAAPGALAVIDMNDLKRINDRYLHAAGDAAIQLVARALRNYFRVTDPLFRTGGDEFLVVMPGGNPLELVARMTKLDGALTHQRLPGVPDTVDIHIAWGVQPYEHDLIEAQSRADHAMYEQKQIRKVGRIDEQQLTTVEA
jgi:diguanylate cyclase (GGDEF)-like protein